MTKALKLLTLYKKLGKYEVHGEYIYTLFELVDLNDENEIFEKERTRTRELFKKRNIVRDAFNNLNYLFNDLEYEGVIGK